MDRFCRLPPLRLDWIRCSVSSRALILGYALFQAPAGRLADRFGPRLVIAVGVLFWSVFTVLTAFVPAGIAYSFPLMIVVRAMVGAGEAVVYPASNRLVADWIPTNERGVANGFIFSGAGFGSAVTPPLITYLSVDLGWKWSFHMSALIGVVAGILWYVLARNKPQKHPLISKAELEQIEAGIPAPVKTAGAEKALPWGTILRDKQVVILSLSYFAFGYAVYIFFSWFFIYLNRARGLDLKSSSFYSMLPFLAMMVASPLGRVAGRHGLQAVRQADRALRHRRGGDGRLRAVHRDRPPRWRAPRSPASSWRWGWGSLLLPEFLLGGDRRHRRTPPPGPLRVS